MSLISLVVKLSQKYKQNKDKIIKLVEFLHYYGYLSKENIGDLQALEQAVVLFKDFYGFDSSSPEITGQILKAIEAPRCSYPDILPVTEEIGFKKNKIKYVITEYVNGLSKDVQDKIFKEAFDSWTAVANISFSQVGTTTEADIIISTGSGRGDNFDGPSGTLAWAELSQGDGRKLQTKFDNDETWSDSINKRGILLLNVGAHEFGHNLGLTHSKVQGALMAPYYTSGIAKPQQVDDVSRIQAIYGKPTGSIPNPTPIPTPPSSPGKKQIIIDYVGEINSIICDGFRIQKIG